MRKKFYSYVDNNTYDMFYFHNSLLLKQSQYVFVFILNIIGIATLLPKLFLKIV